MYTYIIWELLSAIVGVLAICAVLFYLWKSKILHPVFQNKWFYIPALLFVVVFFSGMIANKTYSPDFAMPTFMMSHAPGGVSPAIPFSKIIIF